MGGYGYGVWLLIKDPQFNELVKKYNSNTHLPHVTIMCNMSRHNALSLLKELQELQNTLGHISITIKPQYTIFNTDQDKYSSNDILCSSGFNCIVTQWSNIKNMLKKYEIINAGNAPVIPHLSISYRENAQDLPENINYYDFINTITINNIELIAANIRSDIPNNWKKIV